MGNVTACEKSSGKQKNITIKNDKGRLTKEDIERMVNEAEKYAEEDKQTQEKNGLESYAFQIKQTVEDPKTGEKITTEDKEKLIEKCNETISWIDANQTAEKDEFEHVKKELESIANPIMTKMYQSEKTNHNPNMNHPSQGKTSNGQGPTIEEVD